MNDLAAVRARLDSELAVLEGVGGDQWLWVYVPDLRAMLAAYDAQVARLAAWEQHECPQYRQHHQSRLVQLRRTIAEREALAARLVALEQRATALAEGIVTLGREMALPPEMAWLWKLATRTLDGSAGAAGEGRV